MGVVGLVLALVCSNLAIMLLFRGASQHREISIRMAMGAGRVRIVRQFLTESLVLSAAGGVVGCLAAIWLLDVVSATDLPERGRPSASSSVDFRVLAFATAPVAPDGSFLRACCLPCAPSRRMRWRCWAVRAQSVHHVAMRYAMVSFQVALSIVLLTGQGSSFAARCRWRGSTSVSTAHGLR